LKLFVAPKRGKRVEIIAEKVATAPRCGSEVEQGAVSIEDARPDAEYGHAARSVSGRLRHPDAIPGVREKVVSVLEDPEYAADSHTG
jgi:hypothetical protein